MFWLFLENKVIFQFLSKKLGFHLRSTLFHEISKIFWIINQNIENLQRTETLEVTATILDPIDKDGKLENCKNCELTFHRLRFSKSKLFASFYGEIR